MIPLSVNLVVGSALILPTIVLIATLLSGGIAIHRDTVALRSTSPNTYSLHFMTFGIALVCCYLELLALVSCDLSQAYALFSAETEVIPALLAIPWTLTYLYTFFALAVVPMIFFEWLACAESTLSPASKFLAVFCALQIPWLILGTYLIGAEFPTESILVLGGLGIGSGLLAGISYSS